MTQNHGDKNSEVEVTDQLSVALKKIDLLEDEVECLTGVISVMKEDLQVRSLFPAQSPPDIIEKVKDEQFDYLYASIKARNEQYFEYKKAEDEQLRARLHQLDLENDLLQVAHLPYPPLPSSSFSTESTPNCNQKIKSLDLEDCIQELSLLKYS